MSERIQTDILPENDADRVKALHRYRLLDLPTEESFTNIAGLMAAAFEVPIALISLVDANTVFFKGNVGMAGVESTDRKISLCSFAVLSHKPIVFDKPLEEPCLLANPLVHGDFGLRFYAAAPLVTPDGFAIGSVCLIDKKERQFSAIQQDTLVRFSKMVMHQIELRLSAIKQKEVEQQLLDKDKEFKSFIHQAPVAIFIFRGQNMMIDMANENALRLIKRTADVIGKTLLEAVPELEGTAAYNVFQEVYKTGIPHYGDEVLIPLERAGVLEDRYFNFTYTPLVEDGKIVGVMDVATEVTEQVLARQKIEDIVTKRTGELAAANAALQQSNIELQRSNTNLEEFAHAASHDLKEPIRKIRFFTDLVKGQLQAHLTDAEARSFERIDNATERMNTLIDDLLQYSHVSQRPHQMEVVNLNQVVQRVLEDLELDIAERKAVITTAHLPTVHGYGRQLQQLFQNLLSNALKYSRAEVAPVITVDAGDTIAANQAYHTINVRDNGIGFEQQYDQKIFQMFSRLHGKTEYSGTGVGLSIAKKVAENHHGFIRAESQPGEGSIFTVYLPVN